MARKHAALVVDFGGVLTSDIWRCLRFHSVGARGSAPEAVRELFRGDREALGLLRGLETGELADPDFERRFGALLDSPTTPA